MIELFKTYYNYMLVIGAILFLYYLCAKILLRRREMGMFDRLMIRIGFIVPTCVYFYLKNSKFCLRTVKTRFHLAMTVVAITPGATVSLFNLLHDKGVVDVRYFDGAIFPKAEVVVMDRTISLAGFISLDGIPVPCVFPIMKDDPIANKFIILCHCLALCSFGLILSIEMLHVSNISNAIKKALSKYEPFNKSSGVKVEQISSSVYRVSSDAFVRHAGIYEVKENIENCMQGSVIISKITKISNGVFDLELGRLDIREDRDGKLVSSIKYHDYKFLNTGTPADSCTIPIGCLSTADGQKNTIYHNLMQYAHIGIVGDSGSGKTTLVRSIIAALFQSDNQTRCIISEVPKGGTGYRSLSRDPRMMKEMPADFMPELNKAEREAAYAATLPELDNVSIIDSYESFHKMIENLEDESNWRERFLASKFGYDSIYSYEMDYPDDPKIDRIFVVIDEYLLMKQKAALGDKQLAADLLRLENMVSKTRYIKIHLIFLAQKGTVEYFGSTRDQLFMIGLALPENQSEYVLKVKANLPSYKGVFGYRIGADCRRLIG